MSLQGAVEVRDGDGPWRPAEPDAALCPGDQIRVSTHGRSALRFANESVLRLDQGTTLTIGRPDADPTTLIDLLRGGIHVITRTPSPFRIRTPFVNANVEGTEFLVRVEPDRAQVAVYEGKVVASNEQGRIAVGSGEAAVAAAGEAPARGLAVRPRDAVEWALFVPTVFDDRVGAGPQGSAAEAARLRAVALRREGRVAEALAVLAALPEADVTAGSQVYRAGLLLQVGRIDEAQPLLDDALRREPGQADAQSLQGIVAIVHDDKDRALRLAEAAVARDPASATARIALSYAAQARFDLDTALAQARAAVERDAGNALAWSRVAEMESAAGWNVRAREAAERAVALNPDLSRTQSVLGFVTLDQRDTDRARRTFEHAMALDQADPLPRLGRGIARIRAGDLAGGREDLEIAASLDPGNAIVRSYLGKAYYEEKRDALAATQFELARQRDPQDPTPYLYDAVRKQAEGRSLDALEDLRRSVELNDNRAVFRSRLLLDQDRATRQADLAGLYTEIGSDPEAVALATRSLAADPGNESAHRLLAQAYATRERHDIARASELLQAKMLQPPSLSPIAQELSFTDLVTAGSGALNDLSAHDPARLFERDGQRLSLGGTVGNLDSHGYRAVFSTLHGPWSLSLGDYQHQTDGFRPNSAIHHRVQSAFVQAMLTPQVSAQAEVRYRRSTYGDVGMDWRRDAYQPDDGLDLHQHEVRLGLTARPDPDTTVLAMLTRRRDQYENVAVSSPYRGTIDQPVRANDADLQVQRLGRGWTFVGGLGYSNVNERLHVDVDALVPGVPCVLEPPNAECTGKSGVLRHQRNAYGYLRLAPDGPTQWTLGLAHERVDGQGAEVHRWNPKLGVIHAVTEALTARAAYFATTKRALSTQSTLEPTHVAGFNQFFDEAVASTSRTAAIGADLALTPRQRVSAELSRTTTRTSGGFSGPALDTLPSQRFVNDRASVDFNWRLSARTILNVAAQADVWRWDEPSMTLDDQVTYLHTVRLPVRVLVAVTPQWWVSGTVTPVRQQRTLDDKPGTEHSAFTVLDASMRYTLPRRLGTVSLEVRNLLGARFRFQDDSFRNAETRLSNELPVRRVFLTFSTTI